MEVSIRKNGVIVPIIIDFNNNVWDGIHRVYFAKLIGLKTIPAIKINSDRHDWVSMDKLIKQIKDQYTKVS